MDLLEQLIIYKPPDSHGSVIAKNDPLKLLSKELVKVSRSVEREMFVRGVLDGIDRLIAQSIDDITTTTLNKLIFLWDSFKFVQIRDVVVKLLKVTSNMLCPSHQPSTNPERVVQTQRLLRLLVSLCQCEETRSLSRDDDVLRQTLTDISTSLRRIVFPISQIGIDNIELCALGATALYNVLYVLGYNLLTEYRKCFVDTPISTFALVSVTTALLNVIKGIREDELDTAATLMLTNISSFCRLGINDYHTFSLLLRFMRSPLFFTVLVSDHDRVIQDMRDLLWAHSDSPVDGVSEFVSSCLSALLQTAHKYLSLPVPLHDTLLSAVLPMGWNVRSKLRLLTVLIPYIDCSKLLSTQTSIIRDMAGCLSSQYLASSSGKLYIAIIQQLNSHHWSNLIMHQFIDALTSGNKLIRYNIRQYWLPATLSQFPDIRDSLISELSSRDSSLPALISVYRECKKTRLSTKLPTDSLSKALISSNDEMRSDVIGLICLSSKPSEIITLDEITLLQLALPNNLNIDCPSFRHQIISVLQSWLARISYHIKYTKYVLQYSEPLIQHIQWMLALCYKSLLRGANFQRKETTLRLSTLLVKMMSDTVEGINSEQSDCVLDLFRRVICASLGSKLGEDVQSLRLFRSRVVDIGLTDSSAEIQELSFKFLTLRVSEKFSILWGDIRDDMQINAHHWRSLMQSAKASEAESGSLIYALLYNISENIDKQKNLVDSLIESMSESILSVEEDYHHVVTTFHVYGYMLALERIMTSTDYLSYLTNTELSSLGTKITDLCVKSVTTVLSILSLTCINKGVSPSFEEMEESVEKIISESLSRLSGVSRTELSERVSAWCWLTLKEACCLSGVLSRCSISYKHLLDVSQVRDMSDMFYSTLTRCRHRAMDTSCYIIKSVGQESFKNHYPVFPDTQLSHHSLLYMQGVIEGSSIGLIQFCQAMLQSSNTKLNTTPSSILTKVLDTVIREHEKITTSSVTRRSGGFPIVVQCVLSAEYSCKQSRLLHSLVTELLLSCDQSCDQSCDELSNIEYNEKTDLPQVHSLNILRALVVDSKLVGSVRTYLAQITTICIEFFNSRVWSLRNAATQLFASCSQRMIGQKRQADGSVISTSCVELFSQYPALYIYMLQKLRDSEPGKLDPSIFPILSLLGTLSPCSLSDHHQYDMVAYREQLIRYMISPIYVVRRLTSLCIVVTMTSSTQTYDNLRFFTQSIFSETRANTLHTTLLTVQEMITRLYNMTDSDSDGVVSDISEKIYKGMIPFLTHTSCHVLLGSYLDIIEQVFVRWSCDQTDTLHKWLTHTLQQTRSCQMPGEGLMLIKCCRLLCGGRCSFENLFSTAKMMIDRELLDVLLTSLVRDYTSPQQCHTLQTWLTSQLILSYDISTLEHLTTSIITHGTHLSHGDITRVRALTVDVSSSHPLHLLLRLCVRCTDTDDRSVDSLLREVWELCQPDESEENRLFSIRCISLLIKSISDRGHNYTFSHILQICDGLLLLLWDEISDIRVLAGEITTTLLRRSSEYNKLCNSESSVRCDGAEFSTPPDNKLHYNNAIHQIINVVPRLLNVGRDEHVSWLCELIHRNLQHYKLLNNDDKAGQMFFQEEPNVYYERPVMVELLCAALYNIGGLPRLRQYIQSTGAMEMELSDDTIQGRGFRQSYQELISIITAHNM